MPRELLARFPEGGRVGESPSTMLAVGARRYGPPEVLHQFEAPVPRVGVGELRIRIHAAAVTDSDIFIRSARVPRSAVVPFRLAMGVTRPRRPILGFTFSGVVDACGGRIRRFEPGDEVYGACGLTLGAYAQYRCMPERDSRLRGSLARRPTAVTHEQATAVAYGGPLAWQYLRPDDLTAGARVLVYGASGTSGTLAVQLAKARGAHVTAVCGPTNGDLVRSLGADEVLDYTAVDSPPAGSTYDVVLDSVGMTKTSRLKEACRAAVAPAAGTRRSATGT
ncbi:MAG TPA: NAD(P)-dependent alcohol dehydrogenase [Actinotalea sp.]|nr:NAD(P)-dependent alcohol dehydrogenase [Actinotalea sp.]